MAIPIPVVNFITPLEEFTIFPVPSDDKTPTPLVLFRLIVPELTRPELLLIKTPLSYFAFKSILFTFSRTAPLFTLYPCKYQLGSGFPLFPPAVNGPSPVIIISSVVCVLVVIFLVSEDVLTVICAFPRLDNVPSIDINIIFFIFLFLFSFHLHKQIKKYKLNLRILRSVYKLSI